MKKIGIIVFHYYLANSLSVISSATILAKEGYDVHIFIDRFIYERSKASFDEDNISIHPIDMSTDAYMHYARNETALKGWQAFTTNISAQLSDKKLSRRASFLLRVIQLANRNLQATKLKLTEKLTDLTMPLRYSSYERAFSRASINTIVNYTQQFFPFLVEFQQKIVEDLDEDYVCLLGVEPFGLIAATLAANACKEKRSIPTIYYNLELRLEKECHTVESRVLKSLERLCNQSCYLTIVQDKKRAKLLRDDNHLEKDSMICIPVSGLAKPSHAKGEFLQNTYGIPSEKKVLLYAGNLLPWALCVEMAQAAQNWNDDFVLVLHSWREDATKDPYVNRIARLADGRKVYLSLLHVDWQKMPELLASADIGLSFYERLGENFYEIGHSSNKLVQYLQVGLPIITSDFPSLKDVVAKYQCGECANGPDDIEKLASKIFDDYERYRANAFRCYEDEYDFSKYFKKVIERIKEIEIRSSFE